MNFDATVLDLLAVDNVIFANNFNFNNDASELDNGILTFTWSKASNPNVGVTYAADTRIFTVVFDVIGSVGDDTNFEFSDNNVVQMATASINGQATDIMIQSINSNEAVADNQAPVFMNCPTTPVVSAVNASGSGTSACGAIVNYTEPTATDNCGMVSVTSTANSGDYFPLGFTTVTYTATDDANNSTQCQFVVEVRDVIAPTVSCTDQIFNVGTGGTVTINPSDVGTATDDCTVVSMTVTPNEFTCQDRGPNTVTFTATDQAGNSSSCTAVVTIEDPAANCGAFVMPAAGDQNTLNQLFGPTALDADIDDPCTCRNNVAMLQNGEVSDNGLFDDEILVISRTTGDMWKVMSDSSDARPLPFARTGAMPNDQPADLMRVAENTTLTEVGSFMDAGITYYVYTLEIIHQDNDGYSAAIFEMNNRYDDTLRIANTCFYPEPFIDNILAAYTTDCSEPVTIRGAAPTGVMGETYTFTLSGPDVTTTPAITVSSPAAPEITFDPSQLAMGNYVATFEFDAGNAASGDPTDPGCMTSVQATFSVIAAPENLVCNNNVSVSLDENCEATITPDNILEGDQIDYSLYSVDIMDEFGGSRGNTVTREDLGKTLMVAVRDNCSGNSCMGSITVEDKFAPRFNCPAPITVSCTFDLDSIPAPTVLDNCDTTAVAVLTNEIYEDLGCDGINNIVARVTRTYIARDASGNTSRTCQQVINLEKFTLADVVFPLDYDGMPGQNAPLDCSSIVSTQPDSTGFPTINGGAIDGDDVCKIVASFQDERIDNCGGSYDIVRTWSVFDWCEPLVDGVNPRTDVQIIKVMDNDAPVLRCPAAITLTASNSNCTASTTLPAANVIDACSNFTVRVSTPRGVLESNGGVVNDLPIGEYTITYTATDECGNVASCDVPVSVVDNVGPFAILEDKITVTLNNGGMVEVQAESFNDNSYDNCTSQISLAVKRAGTEDDFAPSVLFSCPDAGQDINVMVRVTDAVGNETIGWSVVCVRDDSAPLISGPPSPITINCTDDITDLDLTGRATVTAGCGQATLTFQDFTNGSNACGEGAVSRVFTARDDSGNESTFVQTINIINNRPPLMLEDIVFPRDTTFTDGCASGTAPENLPAGYDQPQIDITTCTTDQIAVSFSDEMLEIVGTTDGACFKILRTWVVIDWCEYQGGSSNAGRFEDIQVIKVTDNTPPVLTCPTDLVIDLNENSCTTGSFSIPQPTVTDCSSNLTVTQSGDLGADPNVSNVDAGTYTVSFSATDDCGNVGRCQMTVTVRDTRAPQGQCPSVTSIAMTNGQIEVDATRFVSNISDNCTPNNELVVAFSRNPNDLTRTFTCNDIGDNILQIYARDAAGNWAEICRPTANIVDADGSCTGGLTRDINGGVHLSSGEQVEQVMIYINGGMTDSVSTDVSGEFSIKNLQLDGDYTLTPSRNDDILNGVSTFDMVLMLKHILGIKPIDSPYNLIAADINNSASITTFDMVQLHKALLRVEASFPNNTSWRFIPSDYEFTDNSNPFLDNFPEVLNINDLSMEHELANFTAIKVGDLNNSAIPSNVAAPTERSNGTKVLRAAEQHFAAEQIIKVPVFASEIGNANGMQFDLQFATDVLSLSNIEAGQGLAAEDFGTVDVAEGIVSVSWASATAVAWTAEQPLFTLTFAAQQTGQLSKALAIQSVYLQPEVYTADDEQIWSVALQVGTPVALDSAVTLFQNVPNPFQGQTKISFQLATGSTATLSVFDLAGRVLHQQTDNYAAGYHELI
ncbi:MAG: HYR domain-containing protein, partial [Bacteroidota bacterium]